MRVIYPQCEVILDLTQYFQWKYLLAVIVGMTIVELFLGAVTLRFGMKAFWAVSYTHLHLPFSDPSSDNSKMHFLNTLLLLMN